MNTPLAGPQILAEHPLAFSPAADRNKEPILAALRRVLQREANVLEIASGTGQHAAHMASACPHWRWQPTDIDAQCLPSIALRCVELPNVQTPLLLDVMVQPWPVALARFDAVLCANMLHISPWETCAALMQGAVRHLAAGGALVLYGPYLIDDEPTSPGNLAFDADLRARDPRWGLRRLADVVHEARAVGLRLTRRINMPANNRLLVFRLGG